MKNHIISVLLSIFQVVPALMNAQTFEEFKKQREEEFGQFKANETKKMMELQKEFDEFVKQRDKEFTDYLEKRWEAYDVFKGLKVPDDPKPDVIPDFEKPVEAEVIDKPVIEEKPEPEIEEKPETPTVEEKPEIPVVEEIPEETPERPQDEYQTIPVIRPQLKTVQKRPEARAIPLIQKSEIEHFPKTDLIFDFYGVKLFIDYDKDLRLAAPENISETAISKYWKDASETNYNHLVNQMLEYKNMLGLNDWGYYLLVKKTVSEITLRQKNESILLTWFLLNRTGYSVKLAYANNKITIIIPSEQTIYGKEYMTLYGVNYFIIDPLQTNVIHTYARDYHDATRFFDFNISQALNFGENVKKRQLKFKYGDKDYKVGISYDINAIAFYKDYPVVNINIYFDAAVSRFFKESAANSLIPLIEGMNQGEAVNFLLKFVQTAFEYKKDPDQFGREKFFFPEEVIHYPYSDCEDRSVLFSYLVRELLHMKVIGLGYPGHVATAIHFDKDKSVAGSYFKFNDEKYIVADPTYLNAPVGLTMPLYKSSQAEIIELASINYSGNMRVDYWGLANKAGIHKGSNINDLAVDLQGNTYLTGYFNKKARPGNFELTSTSSGRTAALVKFNKYGEVIWASAATGNGISTGFAITPDIEGNLLMAGSFEGQVQFRGYTLNSKKGHPDVFITKYDPRGNIMWSAQAGLDTLDQKSFLKYVARYSRAGKHLGTELYLEQIEFSSDGIFVDDEGVNYLAGNLNGTTGFGVTTTFDDIDEMDIPKTIKSESDALIAQNVERNMAAFIAVTNLVKSNGMVIPGEATQEALDRYHPDFKMKYTELYNLIGQIALLKNADGIVTLNIEDDDRVTYGKIRIYQGAQFKLTPMPDGNERMDILSGVKVGKLFIWFDLNYIVLLKDNGNMIFDYDDSHIQVTMNLKEDIIEN